MLKGPGVRAAPSAASSGLLSLRPLAVPLSGVQISSRGARSATATQAFKDDQSSTPGSPRQPPVVPSPASRRAQEPIFGTEAEAEFEAQERARLAIERIQARWEGVQDKKTSLALVAGFVVGGYVSASVLNWVDRLPLIPDLLGFIGLVYSATFFWKFVLFKKGRESLRRDLDELYASLRDNVEGDSDIARLAQASIYDEEDPTPASPPISSSSTTTGNGATKAPTSPATEAISGNGAASVMQSPPTPTASATTTTAAPRTTDKRGAPGGGADSSE